MFKISTGFCAPNAYGKCKRRVPSSDDSESLWHCVQFKKPGSTGPFQKNWGAHRGLNEDIGSTFYIMPNKGNTADRCAPADFFVGQQENSLGGTRET